MKVKTDSLKRSTKVMNLSGLEKTIEDTNTRNESGDVITKCNNPLIILLMNMKRVIKEYFEQLYAHKFDNLDKMD